MVKAKKEDPLVATGEQLEGEAAVQATMRSIEREATGTQVVDRVVDILEAFVWLGPELGVSEISRALDLKKATAHRLLASLCRRNIVAQDPVTRRYRLGGKLWELGSVATSQIDWSQQAKPHLEGLTAEAGETSHLAVLSEGQVLYIEKVESGRSLRMPSQVGRRLPFHCTGVGKALVAFLPEEVLDGLLTRHGMPQFTRNTIVDPEQFKDELARIRKRGYAVDNEEIEEGVACVAAPVRDHTTQVVAAISIAGPSSRLRVRDAAKHAPKVIAVADAISTGLGAPPDALRARGAGSHRRVAD